MLRNVSENHAWCDDTRMSETMTQAADLAKLDVYRDQVETREEVTRADRGKLAVMVLLTAIFSSKHR